MDPKIAYPDQDVSFFQEPELIAQQPIIQENCYFVLRGRSPGFHYSWESCKASVHRYPNQCYCKWKNYEELEEWFLKNNYRKNVTGLYQYKHY